MSNITDKSKLVDNGQGAMVELGSAMEALVQCGACSDRAATKRGFLNDLSEVVSKKDELSLAYVCEAFQALGSDIGHIFHKASEFPQSPTYQNKRK